MATVSISTCVDNNSADTFIDSRPARGKMVENISDLIAYIKTEATAMLENGNVSLWIIIGDGHNMALSHNYGPLKKAIETAYLNKTGCMPSIRWEQDGGKRCGLGSEKRVAISNATNC